MTLPGGEVAHDSVVLARLYEVPGVVRLQVVQESLLAFRVRVVHDHTSTDSTLREQLTRERLRALGSREARVRIDVVDELPSSPSGKFRFVVSHVPPLGDRGG